MVYPDLLFGEWESHLRYFIGSHANPISRRGAVGLFGPSARIYGLYTYEAVERAPVMPLLAVQDYCVMPPVVGAQEAEARLLDSAKERARLAGCRAVRLPPLFASRWRVPSDVNLAKQVTFLAED